MSFDIPNLRHLRVFLEVARQKSISRASPKVFLSQPAITQAIAKLEEGLSCTLFERSTDGMYLTESGEVWQNRVARALDYIAQGLREALKSSTEKTPAATTQLMPVITSTQLKALVAVTASNNFSVASRSVGVSQSSLHRAARELEQLLCVTLFEKTSNGIASTRAAQVLARCAKLAFSEVRQGYYEISAKQQKEVEKIVIGSMPLARTSLIPETINRFYQQHPGVDLDVLDGPYTDLLNHLRNGDADFLIGALRYPPPADDIVQTELLQPPLTLITRVGHPLLDASNLTLEQLSQYPWVVPRHGTPTRSYFEQLFQREGLPLPRGLVESSSQILIRELLLGSDRITIISKHQFDQELDQGLLAILRFPLDNTRRPIGITHRKNWQPTPAQKSFIALMTEASKRLNINPE